jgi:hypothetical protein
MAPDADQERVDGTKVKVDYALTPGAGPAPPQLSSDGRIEALERKLDRALQELETLRKERSR